MEVRCQHEVFEVYDTLSKPPESFYENSCESEFDNIAYPIEMLEYQPEETASSSDEESPAPSESEEDDEEKDPDFNERPDSCGRLVCLSTTKRPLSSFKGKFRNKKNRVGQPQKLSPEQLEVMEILLGEYRESISSTEILRLLKLKVSPRTVRRAMKAIKEKQYKERRQSVVLAARSLAEKYSEKTGPLKNHRFCEVTQRVK